jgi:TatD DNase family protein
MIERCKEAQVKKLLCPGIDLPTSEAAVKLSFEYPEIYCAVGIHPNEADSWSDECISQIKHLLDGDKVVAVGEIGLDYFHEKTSPIIQQAILKQQLFIASEIGLPVIIHLRDRNADYPAFHDGIRILEDWVNFLTISNNPVARNPGVIHSYGGIGTFAQRAIDVNFVIGVTGPITYNKSTILQSVVETTPIEKILIETDSPFLSPEPMRGKRNEPANVSFISEKISQIKKLPENTVSRITTDNAQRLFNW